MGNLKDKHEIIEGVKVTNSAVRCLGIHIGHDKNKCNELNWMKTYNDMEKLFESWKKRKLTIFGKSCVVNNLAVSKLIYIASILPLPENDFIKKVNRAIFNFIWNKHDRIKRNTLIGKIEEGGIGVIDIELKLKALKASWVNRLSESCLINEVINAYLKRVNLNLNYILSTTERNMEDFTVINHIPKFYQEIFCCFNSCKKQNNILNMSNVTFVQQPLWNNELFKYKGKTLCFLRWIKSGILHVKDLFKKDGKMKTLNELSDILLKKCNWLCEYNILRNVIRQQCVTYDMTCSQYTKSNVEKSYTFHLGWHTITDKKCKFF